MILILELLWLRPLKLNLVFLHQLIYKHSYIALWCSRFALNSTNNSRNMQCTVSIHRSRMDLHRYSFLNYYSRIWKKLPISLRSEEEPLAFKRQLRAFLSLDTISRLWSLQLSEDTLFECGPPRIWAYLTTLLFVALLLHTSSTYLTSLGITCILETSKQHQLR